MNLKLSIAAVLALSAIPASAAPSLPTYKPAKIAAPRDARYFLPGNVVRIYGVPSLQPLVNELNALFTKTHPGYRFDTARMKGPSSALAALTYDVTAFAPLDRVANSSELASYTRTMGDLPLEIDIGSSVTADGKTTPLIFYVRTVPGDPLNPFVKEYLKMVLSKEGQGIVGSTAYGFKPLMVSEVGAQLAKLRK